MQFQITLNLPKWYIQIFSVKMVVEVFITDLENQWLQVVDQNGEPSTLPHSFPYTQRIIVTSIAFYQRYQCTASKALSLKQRKIIPNWARTQITAVQLNNLTDVLIGWLFLETIDIYESPIDNIIFNEPSNPNF